tara:strand:+ start:39 stop:380 length:342 start_codon:yes stop_codon:yes gene_type:complete
MYVETWNTDTLSEVLGTDSIGDIVIDLSKDGKVNGYGMLHNRPHTEDAKQKMRETGKPSLRKKVTLIKDGLVKEFISQSAAADYIGDSRGHMNELIHGKNGRTHCKGWKIYGV